MCRRRSQVGNGLAAFLVAILCISTAFGQDRAGANSAGKWPDTPADKKQKTSLPARAPDQRGKLVKGLGGSDATEAAVTTSLKWLAQHQRPDGAWSFDHRHGPCKANPGALKDALNGATGMALLPFLGVGQSHKQGAYKESVQHGLAYLVRSMKLKKVAETTTGSLTDSGTMYSHGIGTIAFCEAYALTRDQELLVPAQAAVDYIVDAQDPKSGGWRYQAKQAGDTSVAGWQITALRTAQIAGLKVPENVWKRAADFLDSVQTEKGSAYGYTAPAKSPGTTSVGLLSRIYLGWDEKQEGLQLGVDRLSQLGLAKTNLYYNYYATQVMRHHGGDHWPRWNEAMIDRYVPSQAKEGTERGSWYIDGDLGAAQGGRVYCTVLATLALESYYRSLPLE